MGVESIDVALSPRAALILPHCGRLSARPGQAPPRMAAQASSPSTVMPALSAFYFLVYSFLPYV